MSDREKGRRQRRGQIHAKYLEEIKSKGTEGGGEKVLKSQTKRLQNSAVYVYHPLHI